MKTMLRPNMSREEWLEMMYEKGIAYVTISKKLIDEVYKNRNIAINCELNTTRIVDSDIDKSDLKSRVERYYFGSYCIIGTPDEIRNRKAEYICA